MILKRVGRIVGGAYDLHVVFSHQPSGRKLRHSQHLVAALVDISGCLFLQNVLYAKCCTQFEMRPMVERIAHAIGHGGGPFLKLFPVRCVACDISFVHAIGTQGTPFIVIASQPQLCYAAKLVVFGYLLWGEVAMEIYDGQWGCLLMIEGLCCGGIQQEVLVHEWFYVCVHLIESLYRRSVVYTFSLTLLIWLPFIVDCHQMANMLNPPSTTATVPVTKVDAWLMRYWMVPQSSSGLPNRLKGVCLITS